MKDTQLSVLKAQWVVNAIPSLDIKKWPSSEHCVSRTGELSTFYITPDDGQRDTSQVRCKRAGGPLKNWQQGNKTRLLNSDSCLGTPNLRTTESYLLKHQHNKDRKKHVMNKGVNLLNASLTSNLLTEEKRRQFMELDADPYMYTLNFPSSINNYTPVQSSKQLFNIERNTSTKKVFEKSSSKEQITKDESCCINSINATVKEHFGGKHLKDAETWKKRQDIPQNPASDHRNDSATRLELRSIVSINSNTSDTKADDRGIQQMHRQSSSSILKLVIGPYCQTYVVYNVTDSAGKKDQGTSQQFKQRSQGIGSSSVSGNDSSSTSTKRRAIKIESGVSFSVEFSDRGKSTGSETSSPEPVTDTKTKKGKEKKELHRCTCSLSFPTDDKKLKNKPCDLGVCEPGKCTPSECFKRLQEKYGSKKKSASHVSSSQASQTSKKKGRAGKETLLKEKGSSSISKYKETVEVKPLPEKEQEKFNIAKCMKNCCSKLQFWKKDKPIELKPAVIGTDISVKDDKDKSFGSNAATQSGKKKGKKEKKKGEVKATEKKDKKAAQEKAKTETKATGVKTKKGRPLKPYECEPGVCAPKVCIPKECYERKFPPPPPKAVPPKSPFVICLRKLCCRKTVAEEKPAGVSASTQARKSTAPGMPPGATIYKETGSSSAKTGKKRGKKGAADTGVQLPAEGGDVSLETGKSKKQTAYSGIQYFQSIDSESMMQRQGVNIGSECGCSVEFYKNIY